MAKGKYKIPAKYMNRLANRIKAAEFTPKKKPWQKD